MSSLRLVPSVITMTMSMCFATSMHIIDVCKANSLWRVLGCNPSWYRISVILSCAVLCSSKYVLFSQCYWNGSLWNRRRFVLTLLENSHEQFPLQTNLFGFVLLALGNITCLNTSIFWWNFDFHPKSFTLSMSATWIYMVVVGFQYPRHHFYNSHKFVAI